MKKSKNKVKETDKPNPISKMYDKYINRQQNEATSSKENLATSGNELSQSNDPPNVDSVPSVHQTSEQHENSDDDDSDDDKDGDTIQESTETEMLKKNNSNICARENDSKTTSKLDDVFIIVRTQAGRRNVYCKICVKYPNTVLIHADTRGALPKITTKTGARFRTKTAVDHLKTTYHIKCVEIDRMNSIDATSSKNSSNTIPDLVSKQNEGLANTIGSLAYHVYNDGKRLTLNANNFPSRIVCAELARCFEFNNPNKTEEHMNKFNLQYSNPVSHNDILESIVSADLGNIKSKVENCVALSLRADGSVDRTNTDKVFVLAKILNIDGEMENIFFGAVQHDDYATGLLKGIETAVNKHGENLFQTLLQRASSFVTDGAAVNTGCQNGLWKLMDEAAAKAGSELSILNIWCAAHKSELAWKGLCDNDSTIETIFKSLNSLSAYFHRSGRRNDRLKKISEAKNLTNMTLPTHYDIRWTDFTYQMLNSVLMSWECLVLCLKSISEDPKLSQSKKHAASTHLRFLTNYQKLKLIAFLADVLFYFSRFQGKLQSDDLNIVDLITHINLFTEQLSEMKSKIANGSWEMVLMKAIADENPEPDENPRQDENRVVRSYTLHGIELSKYQNSRTNGKRNFEEIRVETIDKLAEMVEARFSKENGIMEQLAPFLALDETNVNLKEVHSSFFNDLPFHELECQFKEMCKMDKLNGMTLKQLTLHLLKTDTSKSYYEMTLALARILVAVLNSADAERSVSAHNLVKSARRCALSDVTVDNYLHVNLNMPVVTKWDPRKAVLDWIKKKGRRQHDLRIENDNHKSKAQSYFHGVFTEADGSRKRRLEQGKDFERLIKKRKI